MIVHKIELKTGRYICPVNVGDMSPEDAAVLSPAYILDSIPEGMISPRWDGAQWVETHIPDPPVEEVEITPDDMPARVLATEAALIELAALIAGGE